MQITRCDPIFNPLLFAYFQEACLTFLLGSSPWEVDEAMVEFGFDIGPFEVQDHIGIDAVYAHIRWSAIDYRDEPWALIPKRIFELGKLGKKAGAGWYRYPGNGGKVEDPIVADLALEEAHFAELERADYDAQEIQSRIITSVDIAGARLLKAGFFGPDRNKPENLLRAFGFPVHQFGQLTFLA